MPLVKRAIEPVFICRSQLNEKVKNELDGVVINSLAGVIKQLSSLSKHAENLFGELFNEASNMFMRSNNLNQRVEHLNKTLKQMDATVREEIKVEEIVALSHFKSIRTEDQQILSRETLPTAVHDSYQSCDPPPALNEFTKYRDDGKEGLKFYTDPNYFYRLWVQEQNELLEKKKKRERKKKRRNRDSQPKKEIRAAQKKKFVGTDIEFRDVVAESSNNVNLVRASQTSMEFQNSFEGSTNEPSPQSIKRGSSISEQVNKPTYAPPPPPVYNDVGHEPAKAISKPVAPPPPPPPPPVGVPISESPMYPGGGGTNMPVPSPLPVIPTTNIAPAPPPPPMPNIPAPPPPPPNAAPPPPAVVKPVSDPRNDLLSAIRLGKQLRKVEEQTQVEKKQQSVGNDVASILARRVAFELTDSESGSDDSESDSDWDD